MHTLNNAVWLIYICVTVYYVYYIYYIYVVTIQIMARENSRKLKEKFL